MARDMMRTIDAIDRAKGINRGLDALSSLLIYAGDSEVSTVRDIGELLWSVQKDMAETLKEAEQGLKQTK